MNAEPSQGETAPSRRPSAETQRQPKHRGGRRWLIAIAVLAVVGLVTLYVVRHEAAKKKADEASKRKAAPIPVSLAVARLGDIDIHLTALGTVTPEQHVTVRSRVDGTLLAVHFKEGERVKAGDPLAEIDPTPFRAAVKQSEGQRARDQAQLKNARVDLERYRNVFHQHAVSEQQVRTQEALVEQLEGTVLLDEGALENARAQLDYASITAPLSGRTGLRLVDPGNMVHASDAGGLVEITQLQPITVIFSISEDQLGEVAAEFRKGLPMEVEALDRDEHNPLAVGVLSALDNQIDVSTGTVKLRATFANEHEELFPSQFVNAKLTVRTIHSAILVPSATIQRMGGKPAVFVVDGEQKAANRPVEIVATDGEISAVSGILAGDKVVSDGFEKLQDGSRVEPKTGRDEPANENSAKDDSSKAKGKNSAPAKNGKSKGGK
ncbi:MAG: Multidrug resistance protein MdtA [Verrucomicrobia bacterium]|nr:Multidrug resistance protein MdtA [Verrucomicrobiota bacterium]